MPSAQPSLPGAALWSDSDTAEVPATARSGGPVASPGDLAMPTIGHIGRYALKYQLGTGGLGTVFAAHDPLLSRLIAVKTLNLEIKQTERASFNALFINEARAAGGLSHPHIVTVFDAGISDNRAYIAMELLKGRDLRQLRQEGWRATPAQAALIVRRVADALAFAHSKGVIHRDVKPANIFMVGRTQPRVLDFGIARITHQREGADSLLGAGSPYYMAPEQVRRETADRRADVFSLGVVLYELLTDVKPFRGESLKEITNAVLSHDPPLAHKVDKAVPKALADITARAMAKDPAHRFRSARSFARELRQWLDANPATPENDAIAPAPAAAPRRRRAALAAVALTLIAAVAGVLGWQSHLPSPIVATLAAAPSPRAEALAVVAAQVAMPVPVVTPATVSPAPAVASAPAAESTTAAVALTASSPDVATPPDSTATPSSAGVNAGVDMIAAPVTPIPAPHRSTAGPVGGSDKLPAKENARDRRTRLAAERETREREARLAAAATAVAATGTVKIAVSPWGEVEVDGAPSGAAPPLTELTLSEGRHQIVVRNGDFAPYATSVNVVAGQVVALRYKFGS